MGVGGRVSWIFVTMSHNASRRRSGIKASDCPTFFFSLLQSPLFKENEALLRKKQKKLSSDFLDNQRFVWLIALKCLNKILGLFRERLD
jgi:hypothetical protein